MPPRLPLSGLGQDSSSTIVNPVTTSPSLIAYLVGKQGDTALYLHCSSPELFTARCVSTPDTFQPGKLYCLRWNLATPGESHFSALSERTLNSYTHRESFSFIGNLYENTVLRSILLGRRILDYQERCATIVQRVPLVMKMPATPDNFETMSFCSDTGEVLHVRVDHISRRGGQSGMMTLCATPLGPLPIGGSSKNFHPVDVGEFPIPIVTSILESVFRRERPVCNQKLFARIYGEIGSYAYGRVESKIVTVEKHGGDVPINPEMSQAVQLYDDYRFPGFAVEVPRGPAKSMTMASMAVTYSGPGVQLFLANTDPAVFEIADAIADVNYEDRRILHIVTPEIEESLQLESPFSTLYTYDEDDTRLDLILATVDRILLEVEKVRVAGAPCEIQAQLLHDVRCIVLDQGQEITEASLNALLLAFPNLDKLVVFGHPMDANPVTYTRDTGSELASLPAMEVLTRRKNLPCIKLRSEFHEAPPRPRARGTPAVQQSEFVRLSLVQHCPAPAVVPRKDRLIASIVRAITKDCVIRNGLPGNTYFTDEEQAALHFVMRRLREAGCQSATVIAHDEVTNKMLMMEHIPVDSVNAVKEGQAEMELSMIVSSTTVALYSDAQSSSASQDAEGFVILGREAIRKTLPWQPLVTRGHFYAASASSPGPL